MERPCVRADQRQSIGQLGQPLSRRFGGGENRRKGTPAIAKLEGSLRLIRRFLPFQDRHFSLQFPSIDVSPQPVGIAVGEDAAPFPVHPDEKPLRTLVIFPGIIAGC